MIIQTFDEFCISRGLDRNPPDFPEMQTPGRLSKAVKKSTDLRLSKALEAWGKARKALRELYDLSVKYGNIRPPTHREELTKIASGHPDNPATRAAQCLLSKYKGE